MAEIHQFPPPTTHTADENIAAYIEEAKGLHPFGDDVKFDSDTWDISRSRPLKGRKGNRIHFSSLNSVANEQTSLMSEPCRSMAKAYIIHCEVAQKNRAPAIKIMGWRLIERAFINRGGAADLSTIDGELLNMAAQIAKSHFAEWTAYSAGQQLHRIADEMDRKVLVRAPLQWKSPIRQPAGDIGIGPEFEERRAAKLPSPHQLEMLGLAFREARTHREKIVSSVCAILCAAPDRVSEVVCLPAQCEVSAHRRGDTGQAALGLRYWPAKGGDPYVKWIVPSMADVVKLAIERIRALTEEARLVSKWYESNPEQLYLPSHLEHLRGAEELTYEEVDRIVFADDETGFETAFHRRGDSWCYLHNVPKIRKGRVSFAAVESTLLSMLPARFPILDADSGLLYSQALMVTRRNELRAGKGTYRGVVDFISTDSVMQSLTSTNSASIFMSLNILDEDGLPLELNTHCFRHYLNTIGQMGGLSEDDIAIWSGRKDVRQNAFYDHVSARDLNALISDAVQMGSSFEGIPIVVSGSKLVKRSEFRKLKLKCGHTTDYGYCVHDFSMLPCQDHYDCMNCDEEVCVKGDAVGNENTRALAAETRELLQHAEAADAQGVNGANRWVVHQRKTLARATRLVALLDDPNVPVGSCIRLVAEDSDSRMRQADEAQARLKRRGLPSICPPKDL